MSNNYLDLILDFKWLIILTVIVGVVVAIIASILISDMQWNQKRVKFLGIFTGLSGRELAWLSFSFVRCVLIISIVAFRLQFRLDTTPGLANLYAYVALCVGCIVLLPRVRRMLVDIVNSIVVFGALIVANILNGYLIDVQSDSLTMTIYVLIAIFISVYAVYFLFRDIADMLAAKGIKKRRRG